MISFSTSVRADDTTDDKNDASAQIVKSAVKPSRGTRKSALETISPEREAILVQFAQQNHPELASLLEKLKAKAPQDYEAALFELDRTVDRIFKSRERSPAKYETQLADWKNLSRIQLLEARFALTDDRAVEGELRMALADRQKRKIAAQQAERDLLQKRLEKLDQEIGEMSSTMETTIDKQVDDIRKKAMSAKSNSKSKSKKSTESAPAQDKDKMK